MERFEELHFREAQIFKLWSLTDTSPEERSSCDHFICSPSDTVDEFTHPVALDHARIILAAFEVDRLQLKLNAITDSMKAQNESEWLEF
ncbi:hypothetical protein MKX01_040419 [Papaver californicum]|nr:hypothetical protein MKX01_040419 [Papaver californicum]